MADSVLNTDEKESSQQISGNLTEDDDVIELIVKDLVASALLNLAEDGHTEQCTDAKKRKYRREELISIVKQLEAQSLLQIPLGLDLTHPVLRDLDKSIPYERASYSHRNGPDRADEIKEQHVGEDQPNLKPSWAGSKFGQGAKQQPHHQASPSHGFEPSTSPKAPTGFPVRSRVLEEDASLRSTPPAKGSQNNYPQATPSRGPWRGQDRDRDNFQGPDFSPEVQDNQRGHATANGARWGTNKPNDSWRGGKYHGQQQQQQQLDNEGRWGSGTEDEGDSGPSTEQLRRVGGGRRWDVEGPSRDRGEESSNRVRAGAGRQNLNVGRSMQMTAADIEAERLAFRRQAEAERAGKQERKRGIYDHDEVDMEDLMENSSQRGEQPAALPANQAVAVSGAIKASPPPGFTHQPAVHEGVKMTFEQLAKASLGHFQGIPGKAMCLEDLEQKMVASAVPVPTQRAVAPPPGFGHIMNASRLEVAASVTTPQGLSNDAASKALLGMLKKAPSPATATPSVMPYGDSRAFEAAAAAAAAAQQQTASQTLMGMLRKGNTQGNSNAPGAANAAGEAGLRSASAAAAASTMAGNVSATSGVPSIPNSVFNAFGEFAAPAVGTESSSVIKAMAAPSLSSIWGAPSPNQLATAEAPQHFSAATPLPLAPLPTPPPNLSNIWGAPTASASPAGTSQSFVTTQGHNPALPSAAQAAATSLFEQLSYSAAAPGSSQAQSALAAAGQGIGQPPQHAARPDNTLATLFAKAATGQLQQMAQAPSEALHSHVQHFQQLPQGGGVRSSFENGGNTAPLVNDTLSLMLKDLGINTEPSNKVPPALTDLSAAPTTVAPGASAAAAARVAIAAWQQQQQGPKPQVPSSHKPAHQTNMFSSGTPQSQNAANLQHLQALMAVNQQQAQQNMSYPSPQMNMQALLQKQQQQHQHIMHEQQMLQFQQELLGIHPAMTQQPAGGPPGFPNGNVVQQLQALKMIQHQQQQHQALAASQQQQAAPRSTGLGPSASHQDPAGKMAQFFNAAANNPYSGLGLGLGQPAAITKPVGNGGAPVGLSVADLERLMGQRG